MMQSSNSMKPAQHFVESEEDFTITEDALEQVDEKDLERITAELEKAYEEYDQKMKEIYSRQRTVVSRIHDMIDQKKIDNIYSQLQKPN